MSRSHHVAVRWSICRNLIGWLFLLGQIDSVGGAGNAARRARLSQAVELDSRGTVRSDPAGEDSSGTQSSEAPNPPADPFLEGCPTEELCNGKADKKVDDTMCWDCFKSYRKLFCEKCGLESPPEWKPKCAMESSVRQVYCMKFAEADPPVLQEGCFFTKSNYKEEFCDGSLKEGGSGFQTKCAEDEEQGPGYCQEWGKKALHYTECQNKEGFMKAFCDTKSQKSEFDDACAGNKETGSIFCTTFATEDAIRASCVEHAKYMQDFCDKKASAKKIDGTCATNAVAKDGYCQQLATQKLDADACWQAEGYGEAYCKEDDYQNTKCADFSNGKSKGKTDEEDANDGETTDAASPNDGEDATKDDASEPDEDKIEAADAKEGGDDAADSKETTVEDGGKSGDEASFGQGAQDEEGGGQERESPTMTVQEELESQVRKGDTHSMDRTLPPGWKSAWDPSEAAFYYYPAKVHGARSRWEKPTEPADIVLGREKHPLWRSVREEQSRQEMELRGFVPRHLMRQAAEKRPPVKKGSLKQRPQQAAARRE